MERPATRGRTTFDRIWLLVGGIVVLAGAIALVIKLRPVDKLAPPEQPATPTIRAERVSPALGERGGTRDGTPIVSETTIVGGARVRDRRTTDAVPYEGRTRPPDDVHQQRLPTSLVHEISSRLQVEMAACTSAISAGSRGGKPRVIGAIFVDVAAGELVVKQATLELSDIARGDAFSHCLEEKWVGQTVPAGDAAATSHYEISVAFAVPPS